MWVYSTVTKSLKFLRPYATWLQHCVCVYVCFGAYIKRISGNLWFCFVFTHYQSYAVNSRPGVDGVDLLCRRLMTQGSRQHRTMAIRMPNSVVISPEKINMNLYCDASAPGFNCTRPTINSMAPISMVTTAMCNTDICANKSKI